MQEKLQISNKDHPPTRQREFKKRMLFKYETYAGCYHRLQIYKKASDFKDV